MSETIAQYLSRITGKEEADLRATERKELLRIVYNAMANDPNTFLDHNALLKEAHYAVARLMDGDQSMPIPKVLVNGTYNTFEFGEVNPSNCTPDKLLYLVKTYPEVWLKRLA